MVRTFVVGAILLIAVGAGLVAWMTRDRWWASAAAPSASDEEHHDHDHADETGRASIVVSEQARQNLRLKTGPVELTRFTKSISVPATVVEQPGHSHRKVAAPFTGMVKQLFIHPSQLVHPGDPIAELELSGDALAASQADLLQVIRELEVNQNEMDRVEKLVKDGAVPERNLLQLQYERRRLEVQRETKIQQLVVLGLTAEQVTTIEQSKQLIRNFLVSTPDISEEIKQHHATGHSHPPGSENEHSPHPEPDWSYTVESIDVFPGKRVQIGDPICSLAFHSFLFLQGDAFEKEGEIVASALKGNWPVTARFEMGSNEPIVRENLKISFLDNVVDPTARIVRLYVTLENEILVDNKGDVGQTYRTWRFKPGQRAELDIPVETFDQVIVVPSDAVVKDGLDYYVFIANGNKFERQAVQVTSQVTGQVLIANDGSIFPGEMVALNNAFQLNLALKKSAGQGGGGHDHAGHSHSH